MKKVLLVLISAVSLLAIACGVNATKPEDLKESVYDEKTGKANSSTIQAAAGTAILADTFGTIDTAPVIVTDAAVYQIQEDGTLKDVTASKDIAGGYLYSITPNVTGSVIISYTYRKPSFKYTEKEATVYEIKKGEGTYKQQVWNSPNFNIDNTMISPTQIYPNEFINFTGIKSVKLNGQHFTYHSTAPAANQFITDPKLNVNDGADSGDFIGKPELFSINLNAPSGSEAQVEIIVYYNYSEQITKTITIPDLTPNKEGTLEGSTESVVVEDASFKKGQLYYYVYYDENNTIIGGGDERVSETGKITLPPPSKNVKYKLWVF